MFRRSCLDCGAVTSPGQPRCTICAQRRKRIRNADRPTARAVVEASPVCSCCGATSDLTADHGAPLARGGGHDGPRRVLCRPCNSSWGTSSDPRDQPCPMHRRRT